MTGPEERFEATPEEIEIHLHAQRLALALLMQNRDSVAAGGPGTWLPSGPIAVNLLVTAGASCWATELQITVQVPHVVTV